MSVTDDQQELLSSTEVDESLMGDKKQWRSPEFETVKWSKMNTFMVAFRSYRLLIDTFLLLVIIGLLLLLRGQWKKSPSSSRQVGGDFTGAGLKCLSLRNTVAVWSTNIKQSQRRLWSSSQTCPTLLRICPSSSRAKLLLNGTSWCRVRYLVIPHAA
jgi:hypothetical protein